MQNLNICTDVCICTDPMCKKRLWGFSLFSLEVTKGDPSAILSHLMGDHREHGEEFFPDVISERRGDTHVIVGEVPVKAKEKNSLQWWWSNLEWAFRTVVGPSSLEILGLSGQNPKHLGLSRGRSGELPQVPSSLNHSVYTHPCIFFPPLDFAFAFYSCPVPAFPLLGIWIISLLLYMSVFCQV